MSEQDATAQEQPTEQVTPAMPLPGARLKQQRESLHLSLDEVSSHLHLDTHIITALETDNYDALPSAMYICGYLRSYARLLKLPEAEIVNAYSQGQQMDAALIPENVEVYRTKKLKPIIKNIFIVTVLVLMIVALVIWFNDSVDLSSNDVSDQDEQTTSSLPSIDEVEPSELDELQTVEEANTASAQAAPQVSEPIVVQRPEQRSALSQVPAATETAQTPPPVQETVASGNLRLVFNADSWTEVKDTNEQIHIYRLVKQGAEIIIDGVAPYRILLGNATAVNVFYKGEPFDHTRFHRNNTAYFSIGKS